MATYRVVESSSGDLHVVIHSTFERQATNVCWENRRSCGHELKTPHATPTRGENDTLRRRKLQAYKTVAAFDAMTYIEVLV